MTDSTRFRVQTVEGLLSLDAFFIAAEQPARLLPGCVLVVNERTGRALTVHATRLHPIELPHAPIPQRPPRHVCLECGRVEGVVEDEVTCPHHGDTACSLLKPESQQPDPYFSP